MRQINQQNNPESNKITILLADDRPLVRDAWRFILKKSTRFHVIAECDSPESALLKAQHLRPDVIILEIRPPALSGIETVSLVKKFSPGSKILGVSLYTFPSIAGQVIKAGASGYVTKTSPLEEMLQAVIAIKEGESYLCSEIKKISQELLGNPDDPRVKLHQLSIREIEVAVGIKSNLTPRNIAGQLKIDELTVKRHRFRILEKLKLSEDSELIDFLNTCQCVC